MSLSLSLQENVLALLIFNPKLAGVVRNTVDVFLFESEPYRAIASAAIDFFDRFHAPPAEHIADLLEGVITGPDKRKAKLYSDILVNLYSLKESLNSEYVLSQLTTFVRQQTLKAGIVDAAQLIQSGKEEDVTKAEERILSSINKGLELFHPGTRFSSLTNFSFLNSPNTAYPIGIKELDSRNLGPARKELQIFIAPPKRGKTWYLVHISKYALLNRLKVLHVTLEMSEDRMVQRYAQSLFAISKRQGNHSVPYFVTDELGRFTDLNFRDVIRPAFTDDDIEKLMKRNVEKIGSRLKLIIKEFPTGALTISMLKTYLDSLEHRYNFIPDLLLIDYVDLMDIPNKEHRLALGKITKDLRGLAVERNIAVVTPSQSNREGSNTKLLQDRHVGEDFSKIATADCVLTYNQTLAERQLGLARIFVADGRNDEDKFTVLISQNYSIGQFALDSVMMPRNYFKFITAQDDKEEEAKPQQPETEKGLVH